MTNKYWLTHGLLTFRATFEEFETKHGKAYSDSAERETRVDLYRQNLRFIHSKNRQKRLPLKILFNTFFWTNLWQCLINNCLCWQISGKVWHFLLQATILRTELTPRFVCLGCCIFWWTFLLTISLVFRMTYICKISDVKSLDLSTTSPSLENSTGAFCMTPTSRTMGGWLKSSHKLKQQTHQTLLIGGSFLTQFF